MGSKSSQVVSNDAIVFYQDLSSNTGGADAHLKEKVSLSIEISKCEPGSTYFFTASLSQDNITKNLGSSQKEIADALGIASFTTSYIIEYFFEKNQPLTLIINKNGAAYQFNTSIASIIGSRNNTLSKQINQSLPDILTISATELKNSSLFIKFAFKVQQHINPNDKYSRFSYLISNKNKLYQSELIPLNGVFKEKEIPYNFFTSGIKLDILNYKGKVISTTQYQTESFINGQVANIPINLTSSLNYQLMNNSMKIERYTFIDYLKSGIQMSMTIGIDFTGSNGHPLDEGSLHRINGNTLNDYQRAIRSCGDIVAPYTANQLFPVYGFGAVVGQSQDAMMCFHVNNQQDPRVYTINNVLQVYGNCLQHITFSGPTHFAPIINQVIMTIRAENNPLSYHTLIILTDGIINDMDATINALVEGSFLPLSVIIVGIGNADFSNMDVLDADDNPLYNSQGIKAVRDLVQFVPFSKYEHNGARLAAEVLEEIPRQVVEFYQMNKITPSQILSKTSIISN